MYLEDHTDLVRFLDWCFEKADWIDQPPNKARRYHNKVNVRFRDFTA